MAFFDFIKNIFKPAYNSNLLFFYIRDRKCGEKIKLLVRKSYDIQTIYEDTDKADYRLNKVVICNKCYNKINLQLDFDQAYNIINSHIDGGELISKEEFDDQ
ncbi:MAG: hypothetical protein GX175_05880 [Halanaerobiaceae bacterium]|nr:hypothetical protein [Halanaerobiaceae bacterium]